MQSCKVVIGNFYKSYVLSFLRTTNGSNFVPYDYLRTIHPIVTFLVLKLTLWPILTLWATIPYYTLVKPNARLNITKSWKQNFNLLKVCWGFQQSAYFLVVFLRSLRSQKHIGWSQIPRYSYTILPYDKQVMLPLIEWGLIWCQVCWNFLNKLK